MNDTDAAVILGNIEASIEKVVEIASLLDDVEQGIRQAMKILKYESDREFIADRYEIHLESWAEDLKRAQVLLGVNL